MKFSIISSILSVASIAAAADAAAAAASPAQSCVPYDGVCFQNGMNYGACCGDGICAGSRCRNPKTEAGGMPTTTAASGNDGAVVTQIGDGQIQVPTSAPPLPTPTPTIPIVNGAGKAMPGLAAAGVALAFLL